MGVVHLGLDPQGRAVAVKIMRPHLVGDEVGRQRLGREVTSLQRVVGPHVAEVLDADVESPTPYLVMRYVPGPPLPLVVSDSGPLRGPGLLRLARGLARALVSIHGAGVVHRDFKPGNVLMSDGDPVVIDFGLAQLADDARLTMTGLLVGTPGFLAPEILSGAPASAACDVHAWGVTLAYAATGRSPYGSGPIDAVLHRVMSREIDVDGLPPWLEVLVDEATHLEPSHRPEARDLVSAIAAAAAEPDRAGPDPAEPGARGARAVVVDLGAARRRQPADALTTANPTPVTRQLGFDARSLPATTSVLEAAPAAVPRLSAARYDPRTTVEPVRALPEPAIRSLDTGIAGVPRPHPLLGAQLIAATAVAAAVAPFVAAIVAVVALVGLRVLELGVRSLDRRRAAYGPRRSDGARTAAATPWHFVRALSATVATLPLAAVTGAVTLAVGWIVVGGSFDGFMHARWLSRSTNGQPTDLVVAAAALLAVATSVLGPASEPLRTGFGRVVDAVAPTSRLRFVVACVLTVVTLGLAQLASTSPAWAWPFLR